MGLVSFPNHLKAAARAGALIADPNRTEFPYQLVTTELSTGQSSSTLVGVGADPLPQESPKVAEHFIEMSQEAKPVDWYLKVHIYKNEIDDDQTGELINKFNGVSRSFQRHKNKRVFTLLNGGDGTTYGTAYDGQQFFDSDHADEGAEYQTDQDNEYGLVLSADNFNTVWTAGQRVKDDRGEVCGFNHNLLIAAPELKKEAHNIAANEWDFDSADRTLNPFSGSTSYITVPELDSTAWMIAAIEESVKPMILVNRMNPYLQEITFDPNQEKGGRFTAHYHARYVVVYGDWRLCFLGNS